MIREQEIVYDFEFEFIRFKLTFHLICQFLERILDNKKIDLEEEKNVLEIAKIIEDEIKNSVEIIRPKSVTATLKYSEHSIYRLYRASKRKQKGHIFVLNEDNVIKTVYKSEECFWFEETIRRNALGKRRFLKSIDRGMKRKNRHLKKKD